VAIGLARTDDIAYFAERFEPLRGRHVANGAGACFGPVELRLGQAAAALDAAVGDLETAATATGRTIDDFRAVTAEHNPPQDIGGLLAWAAGFEAEQLFPAFLALGLMPDVHGNTEFTTYDADEFYLRSATPPGRQAQAVTPLPPGT
jgi:hypothetical protein